MSYSDSPPQHLDEAFNALFQSSDLTAYSSSYEPDFSRFAPPLPDWVNAAESPQNLASTPPEMGGLDKVDATLPPQNKAQAKKPQITKENQQISRWRLKHTVANILRSDDLDEKTPGVCKCGTAGHDVDTVALTRKAGKPGVSGVFYCDSPWLCPTCAPRRAAQRAEKVLQVFKATEARRGRIVFVTLTTKHAKGDRLADLKDLVLSSCRKARQSKSWELACKRYGIAGTLVGPETTYSQRYGWHFHLHVALVILMDDDEAAEEAGEWVLNRYMTNIQNAGGETSRKAQDVTVVWREEDLAAYLSKGSAAWEVSNAGATKEGKQGLTPWDLAARAGRGDARAAKLFKEYAEVMPGTRSCIISKPLAEKLDLQPSDDKDQPGVDDQPEEEAEIVGEMKSHRWHRVLRNGYAADVLKVVGEGWKWPEIDTMIARLLKENERPPEPEQKPIYYEPTAELIAHKAHHEAYFRSGKKGQALQIVLTREREFAASNRLIFVQPNLKEVCEILGF